MSEQSPKKFDRVDLYSELWSASAGKPYDDAREGEVARRRFGPVLPFIEAQLARVQGRRLRVLDFGCADGHTAAQILAGRSSSIDYFGSDLYPLEATGSMMAAQGFVAEVSDGGLEGMPESWREFDVVMALSCLQYVPDLPATFAALVQRLSDEGIFVAYFYDAAPLRQVSDAFMREAFGAADSDEDPEAHIESLEPLASLFSALRDATIGRTIAIEQDIPELGISAGTMPLQRFLIDHLIFGWAPVGASQRRIQWALAEMFLTGPQNYLGRQEIAELLAANGLEPLEFASSPSGHLVVAQRQI